jgi:hypothetical protein
MKTIKNGQKASTAFVRPFPDVRLDLQETLEEYGKNEVLVRRVVVRRVQ